MNASTNTPASNGAHPGTATENASNDADDHRDGHRAHAPDGPVRELHARSVTVGYGAAPVLTDLDLRLDRRLVTALVGPNGSGKSTLLAALSRQLQPTGGAVLLDGAAIARLSAKSLARQLALLAQGSEPPDGLDVRTLVSYGRYPYRGPFGTGDPDGEQMIDRALRLCHLDELAHRPVDTLSGGQRQRAWLASALAQETGWLLADEPTTYLDLGHQSEVLRLLRRLHTDEGRGLVLVLHDLSQAAQYSDRVVLLDAGHVVADGTPAEVITEQLIGTVYRTQVRVVPHPVNGLPLAVPVP